MEPSDRRRFSRRSHRRPVLLERVAGPDETLALTRDVSLGGVAIATAEPLGEKAPVRTTFQLERDFLVAEGRVVWERDLGDGRYECGVEFTRMDPVHRAMVRRALAG